MSTHAIERVDAADLPVPSPAAGRGSSRWSSSR